MSLEQTRNGSFKLDGVVALLLTPFENDGAIAWDSYDRYVEWQAAQQPNGLFAVCGSSEMKWLNFEERIELAKRAVAHANGVPVVATANLEEDPSKHRDELLRMAETGISAAVLIPPPSVSGERERYREYLFAMAEASPCPVMLYEWPQMPNYILDSELYGELAGAGAFVGIKDTTCTVEGIRAKQERTAQATIFQANTAFLPDAIELGVGGYMAITSTAHADLAVAYWRAAHSDETARAEVLHRELVNLDALLCLAYPLTAKYLVAQRGIDMPITSRWPVQIRPHHLRMLEVWQRGLAQIL